MRSTPASDRVFTWSTFSVRPGPSTTPPACRGVTPPSSPITAAAAPATTATAATISTIFFNDPFMSILPPSVPR